MHSLKLCFQIYDKSLISYESDVALTLQWSAFMNAVDNCEVPERLTHNLEGRSSAASGRSRHGGQVDRSYLYSTQRSIQTIDEDRSERDDGEDSKYMGSNLEWITQIV